VTSLPPDYAHPAAVTDLDRMAAVLAAAFSNDPAFVHMLPLDMSRRDARLRRFFALELPRSQRCGGAWTTTDGRGAAVWYPPGTDQMSWWDIARQLPTNVRIFGRRLMIASRVLTELEKRHPKAPHWYLYYLAAEPGAQGTGIGSALLRPVLATCDERRDAAYLEATSQQNRNLYLRHGFVDHESFDLPDDGPTLWPMWRDPK
jgi:GNAT superfamily N-acetyltransferase